MDPHSSATSADRQPTIAQLKRRTDLSAARSTPGHSDRAIHRSPSVKPVAKSHGFFFLVHAFLISDAAITEGSQRMLAQVNARMEAQRRGRNGLLSAWDMSNGAANDDLHNGMAERAMTPENVQNLAEKHGIVVKFVNDGEASGIAQVRALARAHGIDIKVFGENDDGGSAKHVVEEGGGESATPARRAASSGAMKTPRSLLSAGDAAATPPPMLSSLHPRGKPARSLSPIRQTNAKVRAVIFIRAEDRCFPRFSRLHLGQ